MVALHALSLRRAVTYSAFEVNTEVYKIRKLYFFTLADFRTPLGLGLVELLYCWFITIQLVRLAHFHRYSKSYCNNTRSILDSPELPAFPRNVLGAQPGIFNVQRGRRVLLPTIYI